MVPVVFYCRPISIHALLAESDYVAKPAAFAAGISIHALLAESDVSPEVQPVFSYGFLSTLSLRRATGAEPARVGFFTDFYPRSLSAHRSQALSHFYPRSPCGERPRSKNLPTSSASISIHALLAESDAAERAANGDIHHFYPRSPCGERHAPGISLLCGGNFYPRSPCGERLNNLTGINHLNDFYPRSPCGERPTRHISPLTQSHFYPRSPCGERPLIVNEARSILEFLSTLSLRRATGLFIVVASCFFISIHALLAESDHA